jgi:integrase
LGAKAVDRGKRGWFVSFNVKGKRWSQKAENETDARAMAANFNANQKGEKDTRRPAGPKAFDAIARIWWDANSTGLAETTHEGRKSKVFAVLIPLIGGTDVRKLNDRAIKGLAEKLAKKHASESVQSYGRVFAQILKWAVKEGLLEKRPCESSIFTTFKNVGKAQGKPPRNAAPAWSQEQADALLHAAREHGEHFSDCVLFAYHTGCRVSELVALEWPDVDLRNRVVTIRQARPRNQIKGTKNGKARTTDLSPAVCAMLEKRFKARLPRLGNNVFLNAYRRPWHTKDVSEIWIRIRGNADAPPYQWHAWRHTWASQAIAAGCDPGWCADQIGDTPAIFWKRYYHFINRQKPRPEFLTAGPYAAPRPAPAPQPEKAARRLRLVRD